MIISCTLQWLVELSPNFWNNINGLVQLRFNEQLRAEEDAKSTVYWKQFVVGSLIFAVEQFFLCGQCLLIRLLCKWLH